jgi:triosephosphate isomerase
MSERTRYMLGNWKMNTSLDEALDLVDAIEPSTGSVRVGVAPPYPWIVPVRQHAAGKDVWIGAEHAVPEDRGAYTGDVSVAMLAPYIDFVLIGHSEQRQYHPVAPERYAATVKAAIDAGKAAVFCVGEQLDDRKAGNAERTVQQQLESGLAVDIEVSGTNLLVAYEPVWAIGTGEAATAQDADEMCAFIDAWLATRFAVPAGTIPVLYGGSANESNAAELLSQPHVGGLLVGSASLKPTSFNAMIEAARLA